MSNTSHRLSTFLTYKKIGPTQLEKRLALSNGLVGKIINKGTGFTDKFAEKIFSEFPELNPIWLFTGKGEMILGQNVNLNVNPSVNLSTEKFQNYGKDAAPLVITLDSTGNDNIVMVSTKAAASYPVRVLEPEFYQDLPAFTLPGGEYRNGVFRAFEVSGDSMADTIYAGDIVIAKFLDRHSADVRDGYVHVVVTDTEVLVKRVLNRSKSGKLILKSDNESYGNIVLNIDEAKEIWLVKSKISLYLPNKNAEIGKVLQDLQARMAVLEDEIYRDKPKKK